MASIDGQRKLLTTLCKGVLNCQQRVRTLESCLQDTYIVPTSAPVIVGLRQTMADYQEQTKAEGQGHKLGSPVPHLFRSLVTCLVAEDVGQANRNGLQTLQTTLAGYSKPELCFELVRQISVKPCFKKGEHKLTLVMHQPATRDIIHSSLLQLQYDHKATKAPASPLEDELELFLQALQEE